ncbi:MAG TPA: histone deacetylase [Smithellaceae bacterium]|nr:histone deacetylase [Smithellaceae bacterium]HRS88410.1 histone deacetylase [Smithellaceae bacterium]HRV25466.1 histone deacetylase [Smithellaceae bacterium]
MPKKTGVVQDPRYLQHSAGSYHPESPERLAAVYAMLSRPDMAAKFTTIAAREATHKEIQMVHAPSYVEYIASTAGQDSVYLDPDTATSPESYVIAKLAVGGLLNAIDSVMDRKVDNAFALVRPPGHHAEYDRAAGFCIFNNVAVGALHAIDKHNLKKILIVDWDLHHGNGTQHSFEDDPRILYFSTHQYPYYPGTGSLQEIGRGKGAGYTINVPLSTGMGDADFVKIFRKILQPAAMQYKPDFVLLSAGFDTYFQDPLGGMRVTPKGFAAMTRILLDIADRCCAGRFVAVLEGGYHVAGLTNSVKAVLEEMRGDTYCKEEELAALEAQAGADNIIKQVTAKISPYWTIEERKD